MEKQTRELILDKIDQQKQKIELNNQIIKANPEFEEFNTLENNLLKANIKLLKEVLINDDTNVIFEFIDQL